MTYFICFSLFYFIFNDNFELDYDANSKVKNNLTIIFKSNRLLIKNIYFLILILFLSFSLKFCFKGIY
jgi:hypothetical protein